MSWSFTGEKDTAGKTVCRGTLMKSLKMKKGFDRTKICIEFDLTDTVSSGICQIKLEPLTAEGARF